MYMLTDYDDGIGEYECCWTRPGIVVVKFVGFWVGIQDRALRSPEVRL